MKLLRIGAREVLRAKGRITIATLILALQTMVVVGNGITPDSLAHTRDHHYQSLRFADLEVQFTAAATTEMPGLANLRAIGGVAQVSRRFLWRGFIERSGGEPFPVVIVYLDRADPEPVDAVAVLDGRSLSGGHDAVIDRGFARYRGVALGDRLVVNPDSFPARFEVTGVGLSPEYLVPTANPDFLLPSRGSMGVLYAFRDQLDDVFVDRLYNDLVFRYAPGADADATRARIVSTLASLEIDRVIPREANFGYRAVEESLRGASVFTPILALILALMAAAVAFVTVERVIVQQRREIGVLLAHGHPRWQLFVGLLPLGAIPGLAGALLGSGLAIGYASSFARNISEMVGLPPPMLLLSPARFAVGISLSIGVGLACAAVPLVALVRLEPLAAMRGGKEVDFKPLPRPLEALVGRGGPALRYSFRNLFRRVRLSLATVTLIAVAIAFPTALLTTQSTWQVWSRDWMGRVPHDATISFKAPIDAKGEQAIAHTPGVAEAEPFVQGACTLLRADGASREMRLHGIPLPSRLERLDFAEGGPFSAPDAAEVIVGVGRDRVARVGDTIALKARGRVHELRVVGVVNGFAMATLHVPIGLARSILGLERKSTGMLVRYGAMPTVAAAAAGPTPPKPPPAREGVDIIDLGDDLAPARPRAAPEHESPRRALSQKEAVASVQEWKDLERAMAQYLAEYRASAMPLIGVSGLMAFLSMLSVLGILFLERDGEYATLRSMGYGGRELLGVVAAEASVLAALGAALAMPFWWALGELLGGVMARTWFPIPNAYLASDFALVIIPVVGFLTLTVLLGTRSLMRLDLRGVLSARVLG